MTQLYLSIDAATEGDLKRLGKTVSVLLSFVCLHLSLGARGIWLFLSSSCLFVAGYMSRCRYLCLLLLASRSLGCSCFCSTPCVSSLPLPCSFLLLLSFFLCVLVSSFEFSSPCCLLSLPFPLWSRLSAPFCAPVSTVLLLSRDTYEWAGGLICTFVKCIERHSSESRMQHKLVVDLWVSKRSPLESDLSPWRCCSGLRGQH